MNMFQYSGRTSARIHPIVNLQLSSSSTWLLCCTSPLIASTRPFLFSFFLPLQISNFVVDFNSGRIRPQFCLQPSRPSSTSKNVVEVLNFQISLNPFSAAFFSFYSLYFEFLIQFTGWKNSFHRLWWVDFSTVFLNYFKLVPLSFFGV
jgi:hypothetical protein